MSRGGDKLAHALAAFGIDARGRICVDVGASTGGFTHCLLEAGAARVYAVDVGSHSSTPASAPTGAWWSWTRVNARRLTAADFPELPQIATVDVSFISLEKVLPAVFGVLAAGGEAVVLVKPQFEVGKGQVGKGGVVRDPARHRRCSSASPYAAAGRGGTCVTSPARPCAGPKGNREFFLHLALRRRT